MKKLILLYMMAFAAVLFQAQVGINTTTPHPSAALDIQYGANPKGLLAPRMTTAQRVAITAPAESLLVFDTTEKAFYFYNTTTTSWIKLANANDAAGKRANYKLIKSAADLTDELAAGGNSKYLLNASTYYEINGTITLAHPIDLNNAYVSGLDANEDVLTRPGGTIFAGNTGGSIRNLTLSNSAQAFNIAADPAATQSLLVQNTIITGMTTSVGSVSGFAMYFANIVQFLGNKNGITYSNIGNLLLSNQGWFANNLGTYETFTGTFGFIQKNSGFSSVSGAAVAIDVSSSPTVPTGIIYGTVFSGTTTATSGIIKRYGTGSYTGYSFTNNWSVDAPGIPREGDSEATGDINLNAEVGTGKVTSFSGTGTSSRKKLEGNTTSNNLFRFEKVDDNRIKYTGNKSRYFQISASLSYQATNDDVLLILYLAKGNGKGEPAVIEQTRVYGRGASGYFVNNTGILALPLVGTVRMNKDDYIEVWAERYSGSGNINTVSLNLTAR